MNPRKHERGGAVMFGELAGVLARQLDAARQGDLDALASCADRAGAILDEARRTGAAPDAAQSARINGLYRDLSLTLAAMADETAARAEAAASDRRRLGRHRHGLDGYRRALGE